jgi:transketolase
MDRILDISYQYKLSHLSSNLTMYPILEEIYKTKKPEDVVILSAGHSGLAQYVCIEKYTNKIQIKAETLYEEMGIHPKRNVQKEIYCSSGSLGCGIVIAVGMAMANKSRKVYCLITDGECFEGSVWEALSFCYLQNINNLKVYCNVNGFSAYDIVDKEYLKQKLKAFLPSINIIETNNPEYLKGLKGHYKQISSKEELEELKKAIL